MPARLPPTRLACACLLLAAAASAQDFHDEPQRLSQGIQVTAQPLAHEPSSAGHSGTGYTEHRSLPSFPFRQTSATEPAAASSPAAARKLAPRSSATKRPAQRPIAPTPTTAVGTVLSSLAIVLGLFATLVWISKRLAPAGAAALPKEAVELLGRSPLAGRQTMQLIRVGNRLLLVALSANGAETLTEITDPVEVEHLAGLCRRGKSDSASASFGRVLSQLASEPADQAPRTRTRGAS